MPLTMEICRIIEQGQCFGRRLRGPKKKTVVYQKLPLVLVGCNAISLSAWL
jgi:hypothetical protein